MRATRWAAASILWCGLAAAAGTGGFAGPASADWREDLVEQIQFDQDCEVALLSQVMETRVEGRHVIMAKVHCHDRRTFDALRRDDPEPFEFRKCADPVEVKC